MVKPVEPDVDPLAAAWALQRQQEQAWRNRPHRPKRPAVVTFGRFQPPTVGHERLLSYMRAEAAKRGALPVVFPSPSYDGRDNPLPFGEKVRLLRQMFPGIVFSYNPKIKTPLDALLTLSMMGIDAVWMVVGSDEAANFRRLEKYIKPRGLRDGRMIVLPTYELLVIPESRNPDADDVTGMSGTKMRQWAVTGNWDAFRRGCPTRYPRLAESLYNSVRRHADVSLS